MKGPIWKDSWKNLLSISASAGFSPWSRNSIPMIRIILSGREDPFLQVGVFSAGEDKILLDIILETS
jgi:hypothetical protein